MMGRVLGQSTATRGSGTSPAWRIVLGVVLALASVARADDVEWKARISKTLSDVEMAVAVLDGKVPTPGTMLERVARLDGRIAALETTVGLAPGKVTGKDTLAALSGDAASLNTRWQRVAAVRNAAKHPKDVAPLPDPAPAGPAADPAKPPDPPPPTAPSAKPTGKEWPPVLEFSIGSRITYEETGSWVRIEVEPDVFQNRFLMDGYSAHLSFSLRSKGLLANIQSAKVRVAVRMQGPLTTESDLWRTYDVDWVAEKVMNNESKASWMNHDTFNTQGPVRWTSPGKAQMTPESHAHVLSVVLQDGTTRTFQAPKYRTE